MRTKEFNNTRFFYLGYGVECYLMGFGLGLLNHMLLKLSSPFFILPLLISILMVTILSANDKERARR